VSADITTDQKTGQGFYSVKLEIDESSRVMASSLKLLPGMPAEVFITTGERTALSYLLKPFADQVRRAFREPR
jgi:HlyD family secretion protein